jgi:hypothetical protein
LFLFEIESRSGNEYSYCCSQKIKIQFTLAALV